jgi:succinate dehydrogenase / fumarate reductase, cytochrome b subunit
METVTPFGKIFIFRKYLMAITGILWYAFLAIHLLGNLKILVGAQSFNHYAHWLEDNPLLLYAEIFLVVTFALHAFQGIYLFSSKIKNKRVTRYAVERREKKTPKYWMIASGVVLLGFIIMHLLNFRFAPKTDSLFEQVVVLFHIPIYVVAYCTTMVFLCSHLYHGVASSMQTLGITFPRQPQRLKQICLAYAVAISTGFFIIPLYVLFCVH